MYYHLLNRENHTNGSNFMPLILNILTFKYFGYDTIKIRAKQRAKNGNASSNYTLLLLCHMLRKSGIETLIHALTVISVFIVCFSNHKHLLSSYDPRSYSRVKTNDFLWLILKLHSILYVAINCKPGLQYDLLKNLK